MEVSISGKKLAIFAKLPRGKRRCLPRVITETFFPKREERLLSKSDNELVGYLRRRCGRIARANSGEEAGRHGL
jgi:hypothetical protein